MDERQIVAGSAGFEDPGLNPYQWWLGRVMRYAVSLTGKERPKLCWLGTAHGDSMQGLRAFYGATSGEDIDASHLQLFMMPNVDPESHLLSRDAIWVHGGSVVNLLAVWRAHGVDRILRRAWEQGIVLVADTPDRYAYAVSRGESGEVVESRLQPRLLGRGCSAG